MTNAGIGHRMAKGAAWMVLFKLLDRSLGLVSTLVLARLLVPSDFGLVAMATAVIGVLEIFTAFSFDLALIQNQEAPRSHYDTAWTLNLIFAAVIASIMLAIAIPFSEFYAEPRLAAVVCALAAGVLILGFENIGVLAFRKELALEKEFRFLLAKKCVTVAVTITAAFILRTYWALVIGMLVSRAAGVAISYLAHPFRPRPSLVAHRELLSFSKWMLVANIFIFVNSRLADFVIGKLAGASALGLYSVASEVATLPTTELVAPINRATFPGYAQLAGDMASIRRGFLAVMGVLLLIVVPASCGIAALSDLLVAVALGSRWADAAPLIEILAFGGAMMAIQSNSGYAFLALNKPRTNMLTTGLLALTFVPLLLFLSREMGARGAALAVLAAAIIVTPASIALALRALGASGGAFMKLLWRPVVAAGVMYFALIFVKQAWSAPAVVKLLGLISLGVAIYVSAVWVLWQFAGKPAGGESAILGRAAAFRLRAAGGA